MMQNRLLLLLFLIPTLVLGGMITLHYAEEASAQKIRMTITGYDPRDYFQGHYVQFRLNLPKKPEAGSELLDGPYKYYISEDGGTFVQSVLRDPAKKVSVLVHIHKPGPPRFSHLEIEGLPWHDYRSAHP